MKAENDPITNIKMQKDTKVSLELELSQELTRAYKRIDKTENILSAILLITEGYKKSNRSGDLGGGDMSLMVMAEQLVYETVEMYYTDRSLVKDNLSLMVFYIRSFKLKDIISQAQLDSLVSAYLALIDAYEEVQLQKDTLDIVNVKDIGLTDVLDLPVTDTSSDYDAEGVSLDADETQKLIMKSVPNAQRSNVESENQRQKFVQPKRTGYDSITNVESQSLRHVKGKTESKDVVEEGLASANPKRQDSRRSEILRLLSRDPVTIKDISAKVLGCSEKTIQRELNSMLEDGTILRIGEKRWSKYILS